MVLDDYHVIENRVIHMALTFLVEHMPPQLHLMILSRTDPALPLTSWQAKNELVEVRAAELRFSVEKAEIFLKQTLQTHLPREAIEALEERTEG